MLSSRRWTCSGCGARCCVFWGNKSFPGQERLETSLPCPTCAEHSTTVWAPDTSRIEIHLAHRVPLRLWAARPKRQPTGLESLLGVALGLFMVVVGTLLWYWL